MAELTQEQKQQVARWAKEGARLADIQKRIREELGISMTYMDARLLVIELGLELKDVARPAAKPPAPAPAPMPPPAPGRGGRAPAADVADSDEDEDGDWGADEPQSGAGPGAVQVDVDRIMKPGSLVSGTVKFSDGTNATWALDQFGRLALGGTGPGYKPSQQDIMDFQVQLRKLLETRGF